LERHVGPLGCKRDIGSQQFEKVLRVRYARLAKLPELEVGTEHVAERMTYRLPERARVGSQPAQAAP
jgi:hypothetical protein